MTTPIKRHRRNYAVEQEEEGYRLSVPLFQNSPMKQSCDGRYQPQMNYRASDIAQLPTYAPHPRNLPSKKDLLFCPPKSQKTEKKLLSTFNDLQLKLAEAKKMLTLSTEKPLCEFSFQLNSFKESVGGKVSSFGDPIFDKLEESTINLESNRRLINNIKSKERLLWSNSIKTYYVKEVARGIIGINERALEHITISHEILRSSEQMDLPDSSILPRQQVFLKVHPENIGKKVLVLDLDETLFHCEETRNSPDDIEIQIPIEDGLFEKAYVSLRPYAISFLKRCKKHFEIIAFTASQKCYADAILDEIDPEYEYISHRLYRHHCIKLHNKVYGKDLSIINRDLSKMVLVDNSPLSYLFQVENGVPMLPYYGGEDNELLALEKYLDKVRLEKDVRKLNLSTFKLHQYGEFEDCQTLVKQLYCQNNPES